MYYWNIIKGEQGWAYNVALSAFLLVVNEVLTYTYTTVAIHVWLFAFYQFGKFVGKMSNLISNG